MQGSSSSCLPADPKATTTDTGDDLVFRVIFGATSKAQFAEMLNARNLVAGRAVILGDFRLDNDLRVEFAGNDEVRRLVKTFDSFRPFFLRKLTPALERTSSMADSRLEKTAST